MKRTLLPLLLCFLLLLCACGTELGKEPSSAGASPEEEGLAEGIFREEDDEGLELPILSLKETATPVSPEPELSQTVVTLDGISSYLRLTLPRGWSWREGEENADRHALELYLDDQPDFTVELVLWKDRFGMCGTGVSFSDYPLPNGQTATLAAEEVGDSLIWTLILPEAPDSFTIQFVAPTALYESHLAELELLLSTLQQGVKAQLDVVTPGTVTG